MLVSNSKTLKTISTQLHSLLKEWNSKLTLSKVESTLSDFVKAIDISGYAFINKERKQSLYDKLQKDNINLPDTNLIDKAFSLAITHLDGFKEPTRTQIGTAAFVDLPILYASPSDIKTGKVINNEDVRRSEFHGFSLCSFAYKNKISLDEACAKIQHLINNAVTKIKMLSINITTLIDTLQKNQDLSK